MNSAGTLWKVTPEPDEYARESCAPDGPAAAAGGREARAASTAARADAAPRGSELEETLSKGCRAWVA